MESSQKDLDAKKGPGLSRRAMMKAGILFSMLLSLPSAAWAFFLKHFPVRTVEKNLFRFDPVSGLIHYKESMEPYVLTVDGLVTKKLAFSYRDLRALPQTSQVSDFHCVEGWSVEDVRWGGIRMDELVKRAGPKPEARYVIFHALGKTGSKPGGLENYIESMPLKDLLDPEKKCLLVLDQDGKPLTQDHGAPLRLVSPFDLGYKSIKFVRRIEFSAKQEPGWWTRANPIYPVNAPVPKNRLRK